MAKYETPPPVRPLEKLITDFSYTNGLEPVDVFNDFLTNIIHGFSPGAPPLQSWKYKRQQNMKFMQMLTGWVQLMANRIKDDTSWYDPFGDLWHWFPKVPSSHRDNSSLRYISATSWYCAPKRKRKRPDRGWVTRRAEAEDCCWPIMHGIRETIS